MLKAHKKSDVEIKTYQEYGDDTTIIKITFPNTMIQKSVINDLNRELFKLLGKIGLL